MAWTSRLKQVDDSFCLRRTVRAFKDSGTQNVKLFRGGRSVPQQVCHGHQAKAGCRLRQELPPRLMRVVQHVWRGGAAPV